MATQRLQYWINYIGGGEWSVAAERWYIQDGHCYVDATDVATFASRRAAEACRDNLMRIECLRLGGRVA